MHPADVSSPRPVVDDPPVHVSALGHVRATRDGSEVPLGSPKPRAVLAALAMAGGQPVDVDALASLVWPEGQVPAHPVDGLHVYISGLRRVLERSRVPRARPEVLVTSGGGYALDLSQVSIDAAQVTDIAAAARRVLAAAQGQVVPRLQLAGDVLEAVLEDVERALGLWRGEPFADVVPTLTVVSARAHLEATRTALLEDRAVAMLALGRHGEAVGHLGGLVVERALDERLWSLYAIALARSGRQADALEALRTVKERLAEDLGVDPGPALRELEGLVLRQDDLLRPPVMTSPSHSRPTVVPPARSSEPAPSPVPPEPSSPSDGLVGRVNEVKVLTDRLEASGTRFVQVVGEAGIGKSTLVAELVARARARDELVCVARCPEDRGAPPLWPWLEIFTALTDDGPAAVADPILTLRDEVADAASVEASDQDSEVARFRLFESVDRAVTAVAARRRCIIVLEDLHWASSSTARLVAHLAGTWAIEPSRRDLMLVVTRRPDEASAGQAGLIAALEALARAGAVRLDLVGLSQAEVTELARRRTAWEVDAATTAELHARTKGNPFLLVELLRLGEKAVRTGEVPAGVADVIRRRLTMMPEVTRSVLATASVVGNEFDLEVVAAAGAVEAGPGLDERVDTVLDALDPAVAAGLVVDTGGERMAFAHALTRDAVYGGITPARRSRHHARVAEAYEARSLGVGSSSVEAARHWLAAGLRNAGRAWRAARDAAAQTARGFAVEEAADLLDDAVTAQEHDATATPEERVSLTEVAVRALLRAGRWDRFLERVEQMSAEAEGRGETEVVARFAIMPAEAGPWTPRAYGCVDPAAVARLRSVLETLPSADSDLRCRVMLALGSELYFSPDSSLERHALVDEGLAMARRLGDHGLLGRVSQRAALVIWRGGNAEERLALATEAVESAALAHDVDLLQTSTELRMSAALEAGRIDVLTPDLERATRLLEERPTSYHAVVLGCLLVPWLAARGRFDEAQERLVEADRIGGSSQLPWAELALGTATVGLAVWRGDARGTDPDLDLVVDRTELVLPTVRLLLDLRAGDVDAVRSFLDSRGQFLVTDDFTSLFHHALRAEAAYLVGDAALAADAYAALAGEVGHVACAGTGIPLGPVDAFLALAAAATGDLSLAAQHGKAALALMESWELEACAEWFRSRRAARGW